MMGWCFGCSHVRKSVVIGAGSLQPQVGMVGGIVLHGSKVPFLGRSVELCYPRYLFLGWSAELCYTGPRYLFLGWSAELCYAGPRYLFRRMVGRLCYTGPKCLFLGVVLLSD